MRFKRSFATVIAVLVIFVGLFSVYAFAGVKPDTPAIKGSNILATGKNRITWENATGATYYRVYRSETQKGGYVRVKSTSSLSYTDNDANVGETYYYCVKSVSNDKATSATSNKVKLTHKLSRPELLMSKVNADGDVILSWKLVRGAKYYRVYRSENKASGYTRLKSLSQRTFTDTTNAAGKTYYYKVRAVFADSTANSAYSVAENIKVLKSGGFSVGITLNDGGIPSFVWNSINGADSYKIYRSLYENKKFGLISTRTACNYKNESVPKGLTFYYKIDAIGSSGEKLATSKIIKITTELGEEALKTRYVNQLMVYLYALPDADSESIPLRYMEKVKRGNCVLSRTNGNWYRVFYQGELYYLWSENIKDSLTYNKSSFQYTGNTVYQQEVIDLAVDIAQNWKTTYAHEQSNGVPDSNGVYGFDCSGFAKYVIVSIMQKYIPVYDLSADVETLYATEGLYNSGYKGEFNAIKVDIDELQPGDVLFFTSLADGSASTEIGHCGIYLGNNEFAHSTSSWNDAVCIVPLSGSYLENYAGALRLLPEKITPANTTQYMVGDYYNYNLYSDHSPDSEVIGTLVLYDKVNLLYTDNGNWAYIETETCKKGYVLSEYLGEYVYLDYVELKGELNQDNKPNLFWNKVANAVKYDIYRSLKANSDYSLISSTENTYYTNLSAISGLDLYYKVVAYDASGEEIDTSDIVKITTPLGVNEELLTRYVNLPELKLYALPTTSSDAISLRYMQEVLLGVQLTSSSTGSWYRAFYNDTLMYLWQGTEDAEKLTSVKSTFTYEGKTQYQQKVIDLALEIYNEWDTVYATGQSDGVANSDGTYGFNAPGLVKYVLNSVMQEYVPTYNLSVVLDTLYTTNSVYNYGYDGELRVENISLENIQPGDVLFLGSGSTVSYCGLYLGNGEFISCLSSWDEGVEIMPLSDKYSEALISIRRYLPENVTPANEDAVIDGPYKNYKVYAEKSADSEVIVTPALDDTVTILFTDSEKWAYIQTESGVKGYMLLSYLT